MNFLEIILRGEIIVGSEFFHFNIAIAHPSSFGYYCYLFVFFY